MERIVTLLLLIGHFLGDFYFQTNSLAKEKESSVQKLLLHCLIYWLVMVAVLLPVFNWSLFWLAATVSFLHLLIDGGKHFLTKRQSLNEKKEAGVYLVDQACHIFVLLTAYVYLVFSNISIRYLAWIDTLILGLGIDMNAALSWVLILLILIQPASITIRKVLNHYRPDSEEAIDDGIPNAGALIGIFERFIILLMLSVNQLTAIGFVLTAKSVARYNKISENPQFAEYYLLGTLLSSLLIILFYYLIF